MYIFWRSAHGSTMPEQTTMIETMRRPNAMEGTIAALASAEATDG